MRAHAGPSMGGRPTSSLMLAGKIVDVDPLRWTCIVRTEEAGDNCSRVLYDVPLGGPYLHPLGEGVYVMPDIGALVEVCLPSDGSPTFIAAYRPYSSSVPTTSTEPNKPSAAGNRPRLSPGDMGIVGRDRNGLFIRRGQLTEVFGGPLARTFYHGRTGTVQTLCQAAKLDAFGGSARWEVDRPEEDPDGHQATRLDLKLKEYADDRAYVVRLQVGGSIGAPTEGEVDGEAGVYGAPPESTEQIDTPVLRLRVYVDGDVEEADLAEALSLCLDKGGVVELSANGIVYLLVPKVVIGAGTAPVLYDLNFSTKAAAAWAEVSAIAKVLGMPTTGIDAHIADLNAAAYTAAKLETD